VTTAYSVPPEDNITQDVSKHAEEGRTESG
jgi:hypothetical protein